MNWQKFWTIIQYFTEAKLLKTLKKLRIFMNLMMKKETISAKLTTI